MLIKDMEFEMVKLAAFVNTRRLVIDFSGVEAASSAVFGLALATAADAEAKGIAVRVCSLSPVMRKAFEMLSEKELVEVFENVRKACTTPWERKKPGWWPF